MVLIMRMMCGTTRAYSSAGKEGSSSTNPFHHNLNDALLGMCSTADTSVSMCDLEYSGDSSIAVIIRMNELYSLVKSMTSTWSCTNAFHMSEERESGA